MNSQDLKRMRDRAHKQFMIKKQRLYQSMQRNVSLAPKSVLVPDPISQGAPASASAVVTGIPLA